MYKSLVVMAVKEDAFVSLTFQLYFIELKKHLFPIIIDGIWLTDLRGEILFGWP